MKKLVTILDKKNEIQTLSVTYKPSVIIANSFESAEELGQVVKRLGYKVGYTAHDWPRDYLISFNDKYIARNPGNRAIAEGGCFVFGKDYLIFSENIVTLNSKTDSKKRILRNTLEQFFEVPVYSITGYYSPKGLMRHIDLTLLPIPQREMLIVDNRHYIQATHAFKQIAKAQHLELVVAKHCSLWALNCLVLEYQSNPVVIANDETTPFLKLLDELKLDYEMVTADTSPLAGGSIRCRTNTAANIELFKEFGFEYTSRFKAENDSFFLK
ncbi:MAG: hypothetical protein AABW48_00890 [Nanoarchaeota archaeon]